MPENCWEHRLRAAGLRVTRPRMLVADTLTTGSHLSADQVLQHLSEAGTPLPRASVYNVLDAFVRAGVTSIVHRGPGQALYELADADHDHFTCSTCDALLEVPRRRIRPPVHPGVADVTQIAVVYRGLCTHCA